MAKGITKALNEMCRTGVSIRESIEILTIGYGMSHKQAVDTIRKFILKRR